MEVILLEKVKNLGTLGDCVRVRSGFGRNYLIPQGKAVSATKSNIAKFEARRSELEKKAEEVLSAAKSRAEAILKVGTLTIPARTSTEGKLYGSVGTSDIVEALAKLNVAVERKEIRLPSGPLRFLGEYDVVIQLPSEVASSIRVQVVAQEENNKETKQE